MAKGRVAEVVSEGSRFGGISVNAAKCPHSVWILGGHSFRHAPRDLGHLQGMRQAVVEDMTTIRWNHLRDFRQPGKRRGIQDAIAIDLGRSAIIFRTFFLKALHS